MTEHEYVLGTHDEEVDRLALQHRVWWPEVHAAWQAAGFGTGHHLLDVGCGPGFAALDLAGLVGPSGRVIGIDASRRFLDVLETAAVSRSLQNVTTVNQDLDDAIQIGGPIDGAWVRWVFAFVKHPRRLVEQLARWIKPGGAIAIHEYFDYGLWQAAPPSRELDQFVAAVIARWRESGGEPNIGLMLPRWLEECGFEITELRSIVEIVDGLQPKWQWLQAFVDSGSRRLEALGDLSATDAGRLRALVEGWARDVPPVHVVTPGVIEIVARRPS
jgi:ubiquinone/menaquinone biosynthesis C-methylase UbiE